MEEIGTRNRILDKFKWDKAKEAEKAERRKAGRHIVFYLTLEETFCIVSVATTFTVHEMHMGDIELEPSSSLIVTTKVEENQSNWCSSKPASVLLVTSVPWQYSIPEMPCAALFRIGGADASFPYAEYIDIVILLPFVGTTKQNRESETKGVDEKLGSKDGDRTNVLANKVVRKNEVKHIKWRWVRPKVHGNLPPPRRSHSSTYVEGSRFHRLVMYGGGSSTSGIKNFDDLWVLDTYTDSTYQDYMDLKAMPPPASFKATIDNINVVWTKPKID